MLQVDAFPGKYETNVANLLSGIKAAAQQGADLVVFPEMADTGYVMDAIAHVEPGRLTALDALCDVAQDCQVAVIGGILELDGERRYNSLVAIDPTGDLVGRYRKIHLFGLAGERAVFDSGGSPVVVQICGTVVGLAICFDLRFPELFRRLALAGAQLFVVPSAFPMPRSDHWRLLTRARALENQCFVVAANRVGTDGSLTFCGTSCVVDPWGSVVASLADDAPGTLHTEIALSRVTEVRDLLPTFEARRPDAYDATVANGLTATLAADPGRRR